MEKQEFLGGLVAKPVVAAVAKTILKAGLENAMDRVAARPDNTLRPADVEKVAKEIATELGRDPKAQNALNAEPAYQSRVIVGSSTVIGAQFVPAVTIPHVVMVINFMLPGVSWDISSAMEADAIALVTSVVTLWGAGYAIYGRLRKGMEPLFARWGKK